MKFLTGIFFLLLAAGAFAQSRDTVSPNPNKKPLIVIDGVIYDGDFNKINPKDILSEHVLKPPGSTNIYGKQGADGLILITTKPRQNIYTLNKVIELSIIVLLILLIVYYQLKAKWQLIKKISFNRRR